MNFIIVLILFVLFFILLLKVLAALRYRLYKANAFENKIYSKLANIINKNYVYKNIYIKRQNGRLTELDALAVHATGIYVFECKNYGGVISGNIDKKEWKHTYENGEKHIFFNPVFQNEVHINAVKFLTKNYDIPYYSIIIFSDRCEIENISGSMPDTFIINENKLNDLMKKLFSYKKQINEKTLRKINNDIKKYSSTSKANHRKLIKDMKKGLTKCPHCNGDILEIKNKKSKYYRCSNYPKCKYKADKLREII